MINGNMIGIGSVPLKTVILEDESGNTITGVVTESKVIFDATPADVRIGKTFASDEGICHGENTITYRTSEGSELVLPGEDFSIIGLYSYNKYRYTKLQCVISKYTSSTDKTAIEKIVLNDNVYNVGSSNVISTVTKDDKEKTINLNISNDTNDTYIIYFFTYSEEEA